MIDKPSLDTKTTGGVVGQPEYKNGESTYIKKEGFDTSGGSNLDTAYEGANLSAKYKNPRVKQDIPEKANQYEDHE